MAWQLTQPTVWNSDTTVAVEAYDALPGYSSPDWDDSMAVSAIPFMLTDAAGNALFLGLIEHDDLVDPRKRTAMLDDNFVCASGLEADGIEYLICGQWCVAIDPNDPNDRAFSRNLAEQGGEMNCEIYRNGKVAVEFWS